MLTCAWVEIEGSGIGNIAPRVIRHDRNVIAYFVLLRPTFERVKGIAHRHVRRPCETAIHAVRIEQLRVDVIRSISRIQPHGIDSPVGRDRQCTEPVPFVMINGIVVDSVRRTECQTTVSAPGEHYVGAGSKARWLYTGDDVDIVVSGPAGAVHCQEQLPQKSAWIRSVGVSEVQIAAKTYLGDLVKSGRDCRVLRIA